MARRPRHPEQRPAGPGIAAFSLTGASPAGRSAAPERVGEARPSRLGMDYGGAHQRRPP